MYEAADIDGAGPLKRFWYITVPYLKPITTYVLLTSIIGTLQMFDQAYIFSNGSGEFYIDSIPDDLQICLRDAECNGICGGNGCNFGPCNYGNFQNSGEGQQ